jgi:hypothetical protein
MKLNPVPLFCIATLWSAGLVAQSEFRQRSAHTHGVAKLTILQDRHALLIELESPTINIVGFEHEPRDDNQIELMKNALMLLKQPDSILQLSSLDCEIEQAVSNISGAMGSHAHSNLQQNDLQHNHSHNHSEFQVIFGLNCASQTPPAELVITAFENFRGIQTLEIQWAINGLQGMQRLNPTQTRIRFRQ